MSLFSNQSRRFNSAAATGGLRTVTKSKKNWRKRRIRQEAVGVPVVWMKGRKARLPRTRLGIGGRKPSTGNRRRTIALRRVGRCHLSQRSWRKPRKCRPWRFRPSRGNLQKGQFPSPAMPGQRLWRPAWRKSSPRQARRNLQRWKRQLRLKQKKPRTGKRTWPSRFLSSRRAPRQKLLPATQSKQRKVGLPTLGFRFRAHPGKLRRGRPHCWLRRGMRRERLRRMKLRKCYRLLQSLRLRKPLRTGTRRLGLPSPAATTTTNWGSAWEAPAPPAPSFEAVERIAEVAEPKTAESPMEEQVEAAQSAQPDMDELVARVLVKMNPEVLQKVTREILKPVIEAIIRDELDCKKS